MNIERLQKLANYLKTVDPCEFNLSKWKCRTQACAIGHAGMIPEFNQLGLHLTHNEDDPYGDDIRRRWIPIHLLECCQTIF